MSKELIELIYDMYFFIQGLNNSFCQVKISNGRDREKLLERFNQIKNELNRSK